MKEELNKVKRGDISEISASIWLLKKGYEVFRNITRSGIFDIIAWKDNDIQLIDVTTITYLPSGEIADTKGGNKYKDRTKKFNIKYLYVFKDGSCKWREELFPEVAKIYCMNCEKLFLPNGSKFKFCSKECRKTHVNYTNKLNYKYKRGIIPTSKSTK